MLLDDRGAQRHRGDGHTDTHGVIGQSDLAAEQVAHVRDGRQVGVLGRRRIGAGALEQHQVAAAGGARRAHGLVEFRSVAMPVEMISGLPVDATLRISGRWMFSNDAIL